MQNLAPVRGYLMKINFKFASLSTITVLVVLIFGLLVEIHSQRDQIAQLQSGATLTTKVNQQDFDIPIFQIILAVGGFGISAYQLYVSHLCESQIKSDARIKRQSDLKLKSLIINASEEIPGNESYFKFSLAESRAAKAPIITGVLNLDCPLRLNMIDQLIKNPELVLAQPIALTNSQNT